MNKSRVAIIAGAGSGIGRAAAIELAGCGYQLVLVARRQANLQETARLAGRGLIIAADLTDPAAVDQIVGKTMDEFGRIDALVNSAGAVPQLSIEQTTPDEWRRIIDANLSAPFYYLAGPGSKFKTQQAGVVVNISSMAARDPFTGFAAYGAAKAGLNILSLMMAREGAPFNIRVHTIAPGAVETEMFRSLFTVEQFPTEKTMQPAEVGKLIRQCIEGELRYTSGEVIYIHKTM